MSTNIYRALRELLPDPALLVATVSANYTTETLVTFPGGAQQRVRGSGYTVGSKVFIRAGVIEGQAPSLTVETIDV